MSLSSLVLTRYYIPIYIYMCCFILVNQVYSAGKNGMLQPTPIDPTLVYLISGLTIGGGTSDGFMLFCVWFRQASDCDLLWAFSKAVKMNFDPWLFSKTWSLDLTDNRLCLS